MKQVYMLLLLFLTGCSSAVEPIIQPTMTQFPTTTLTIPVPTDTATITPTQQTPPSGRLVFASWYGELKWILYSYDLDNGILSPLLDEQFDDVYMLSSDTNGEILAAVVGIDRKANIYLIDLTDNSHIDLTPENTWEDDAWVSPDGSMVAFSSDREGLFNIFVYRIDEGTFENLTGGSFGNCSVEAWSPDNQKILFFSDLTGSSQPYVFDLSNSEVSSVGHIDTPYYAEGTWSPDGNFIAFTTFSKPNIHELFRVDSNGENQISLLRNESELRYVYSWSPDSSLLFMIYDEKLYLVDVESGELQQLGLTEDCSGCGNPSWSQDGDFVAYDGVYGITIIYLDNIDDSNVITSTGGDPYFLLWLP